MADRAKVAHFRTVQCALGRHDEATAHQWMGREFGAPPAAKRAGATPGRCGRSELREVGHRKYKAPIRLLRVRCSREAGHEGVCSWRGREFGAAVKPRDPGRHKAPRSATRAAAATRGSVPATSGS